MSLNKWVKSGGRGGSDSRDAMLAEASVSQQRRELAKQAKLPTSRSRDVLAGIDSNLNQEKTTTNETGNMPPPPVPQNHTSAAAPDSQGIFETDLETNFDDTTSQSISLNPDVPHNQNEIRSNSPQGVNAFDDDYDHPIAREMYSKKAVGDKGRPSGAIHGSSAKAPSNSRFQSRTGRSQFRAHEDRVEPSETTSYPRTSPERPNNAEADSISRPRGNYAPHFSPQPHAQPHLHTNPTARNQDAPGQRLMQHNPYIMQDRRSKQEGNPPDARSRNIVHNQISTEHYQSRNQNGASPTKQGTIYSHQLQQIGNSDSLGQNFSYDKVSRRENGPQGGQVSPSTVQGTGRSRNMQNTNSSPSKEIPQRQANLADRSTAYYHQGQDDEHDVGYQNYNLQRNPSPNREPQLDYDSETLHRMSFDNLASEPFDFNPKKRALQRAENNDDDKPLQQRLRQAVNLDEIAQNTMLSDLTLEEWEEAGEWFMTRFSELMKEMTKARRDKRRAAAELEREVAKRNDAIANKQQKLEEVVKEMRSGGESLLKTPRKG